MENDIRAGRAFVDLFLRDTSLTRGLSLAEGKLKAFGSRISSMGATLKGWGDSIAGIGKRISTLGSIAAGGLLGAAKTFASMGGSLTDMSDRTGMSVEGIQELGHAARMTGASTEDLETGIRKMQKTIAGAEDDSKKAQEALADLGITVADLAGLNPEQQFERIADRLASIRDPGTRAAAAMEIFGKSGTKLLPMMAQGAAGIEDFRKKARDLGLVLSAEDVAAGDKFGDTLDTLWQAVKVGTARVGAQLIPMLTEFANKAIEIIGIAGAWVAQNKGLVVSAFKVAMGIAAGGAALFALGKIITGAGIAVTVFGSLLSGAGVLIGSVGSVLSLLLSPLGLIVGALIGGGAAFLYFSGIGGQVGDYLGKVFSSLASDAVAAFGAIGKALAGGDLAAAAKVVWSLIKMEWVKGTSWILGVWADTKTSFLNIWADASMGIAKMMIKAWALSESACVSSSTAMAELWIASITLVGNAWDEAIGWIQKRWLDLKGLIDDTVDVAAEKAAIDRGTVASTSRRNDWQGKELAAAEWSARTQTEATDRTKQSMLEGVDEQAAYEKKKRLSGNDATLKQLQAEAEAAKAEFATAVSAAKATAPMTIKPGMAAPGQFNPNGLDLEGKAAKPTVSASGTFSGSAAWGLGGGSVQTRIAAATEKTAAQTEKIAKLAQQGGGMVWGT